MVLESIDDLGNETFTVIETVTWEGASEWDAATSEAGVVHETDANRDIAGDGTIQLGYPSTDEFGSGLVMYYPLDKNAGSTVYDAGPNALDGSYSGTTTATGLHNTDAPDWDAVDDTVEVPHSTAFDLQTWTVSAWVYLTFDPTGTQSREITSVADTNMKLRVDERDDSWRAEIRDVNDNWIPVSGTSTPSQSTWYHVVATYDGSTLELYENATSQGTVSDNGFDVQNQSRPFLIGVGTRASTSGERLNYWGGRIDDVRVYDRALSSTEVQSLYDTGTTGSLTTATKSFSSPVQPDLQNLSYVLNGESISLDVIGSPGQAGEETVTQSLTGASSYSLTWSSSHTDFRVTADLSTTDVTTSPTLSRVELTT